MTKAEALRKLVATLDGEGLTADEIAAAVGITVARVDRILDDQDPQHDTWVRAPAIEPLIREPKTDKGEGTQLRVRSSKERGEKPRRKPTPKTPQPRKVIECGTVAGFYRHKRLSEPKCQPCRDAYLEYDRVKRPRVGGGNFRDDIVCGTPAGRGRHKRMREPICEPCRLAYNEWQRARYQVNGARASPVKPINHGTAAGFRAHRRRGETPCDACHEAYNKSKWKPINHGTHGGYMAHRRRGEEPCDPCRAGHSETNQRHKKKAS